MVQSATSHAPSEITRVTGSLLLFAIAGFLASFVDGALGMGFGPTGSSILMASGLAPQAASATVNIAKVVTGLAAGLAHWRFDNLDRKLVLRLAIPGSVGALFGVTVLANVSGVTLRPYLAMLLVLVGVRILVRFAQPQPVALTDIPLAPGDPKETIHYDRRGVKTAAFIGGITNGLIGAWGPVVTPFLLHRGVHPRYAIGCVNTAEILVASTAASSLVAAIGSSGVSGSLVLALLIGGVAAAPIAAWAIRLVPARPMGVAVGTLLLLTNGRDIMGWANLSGPAVWLVYGGILATAAYALVIYPQRRPRPPIAVKNTT
jgi:uncharacterized membrane protein YfcA